MAGWLPRVVAVVGSRLGTVIVFGIEGASQAGFYFIASSIFYAIAAVADSMFSVSFPILSAMNDRPQEIGLENDEVKPSYFATDFLSHFRLFR